MFHNSHDKFDRQIIVSNQTNQIESWRKHTWCAWVWKRVCDPQGSNSWPRAWRSMPMFRAKCDTTQPYRRGCGSYEEWPDWAIFKSSWRQILVQLLPILVTFWVPLKNIDCKAKAPVDTFLNCGKNLGYFSPTSGHTAVSWKSGRFQFQRSPVRVQSSAKFL